MAEENPYAPSQVTTTRQMGSLNIGGLANLGQEARLKQLRTARWILIIVGIICVAGNIFAYYLLEGEIKKLGGNVDLEKIKIFQYLVYGSVAIGALFVVMGIFVYQFPVPITLTGLILYIVIAFGPALFNPETIFHGILLKILIIAGLLRAFQAAQAYERQRTAETIDF